MEEELGLKKPTIFNKAPDFASLSAGTCRLHFDTVSMHIICKEFLRLRTCNYSSCGSSNKWIRYGRYPIKSTAGESKDHNQVRVGWSKGRCSKDAGIGSMGAASKVPNSVDGISKAEFCDAQICSNGIRVAMRNV